MPTHLDRVMAAARQYRRRPFTTREIADKVALNVTQVSRAIYRARAACPPMIERISKGGFGSPPAQYRLATRLFLDNEHQDLVLADPIGDREGPKPAFAIALLAGVIAALFLAGYFSSMMK